MPRLQIDMLPVGDSDAFLLEVEVDGARQVILIDGGRNWEDGERILRHLRTYYGGHVDHLVLSHIDHAHASGLVYVVEKLGREGIGQAWVHDLSAHGVPSERAIERAARLAEGARSAAVRSVAQHLRASVEAGRELIEALGARGIPTAEPFADRNDRIGPLQVLGPTEGFLEECVHFFGSVEMMDHMVEQAVSFRRGRTAPVKAASPDEILNEAIDDPETTRQASLIALLTYDGDPYLFPGDAGRRGLRKVQRTDALRELHWLKVPGHGSKHNLDSRLLDLFSPALAYISASGIGINPHPALVSALKDRGAVVYTTAGSGNVWHRRGNVAPRGGFKTRRPR